MLAYINGKLISKTSNAAIIDVGGIGYFLEISHNTACKITAGESTKLFCELCVGDKELRLFGFHSPEEKAMFLRLTSISGIGPKSAIAILSGAELTRLAVAISSGDVKFIAKAKKDYAPSEMLKTPRFYLVTATFMLACMGGLMMIGFAKPIAQARPELQATAVYGVLAITLFNSLGRLFWGAVSDKLGRKNTIITLLTGTAVLSLLVNVAPGYTLYGVIALIGFCYGGLLSNFPSLTADLFGPKHMATNYGIVLLGFGAGAVISLEIAGHFRNVADKAGDINKMFPAFIIASGCAVAGIIMMFILKALRKKQKTSSEQA